MIKEDVVVALACVMLAAPAARAQDRPESSKSHAATEITPFVFLGPGSSNGVGAAVRWPFASRLSLELETSYRQGEIGALSSSLSLLFDLPQMGSVTPYVAGGVGVEQYGSAELIAGNVVARGRTGVSVNAGGGIRVQTDQNWGIRTDARWINIAGNAPERWRLYNGVTFGGARR